MRLLFAEDEERMAKALAELLRLEQYEVDWVPDGISALDAIEINPYDVIVLDVMMPRMNGLEVAAAVRRKGIRTPILMLTAKDSLEDKVTGLDSGADDYLTKPFMTEELLARLRAIGRRSANIFDKTLRYGDLSVDMGRATLTCVTNGQSVRLARKELLLLEYLILNQGQILNREQLAVRLWGTENEAEYNNVEVYISFTRKKLRFIGSQTGIKAVRGIGYELRYENVS